MKSIFKRVLSLAGAAVMIVNTLPVTAYAAEQHTITFDANGGQLYSNASQGTRYNRITYADTDGDGVVTVTYPFNYDNGNYSVSRAGYELVGWENSGEVIKLANANTFKLSDDETFSAVWEGNTYNVTYYDTEGNKLNSNVNTLQVGSDQNLSLQSLGISYQPNGKFIGWNYEDTDGNISYFDGYGTATVYDFLDNENNPVFDSEDVSLTAVVVPEDQLTITVSYDANGGGGTPMAASTFTYGDDVVLSTNKYQRVGYTFAGWSTEADSTQAQFTDSQDSAVNFGLTSDTTLYAVWTKTESDVTSTYDVTFVKNAIQTASGTTKYTNITGAKMNKTAQQYYNSAVNSLSNNTLYQQGYYVSGIRIVKLNNNGTIAKQSPAYAAGAKFAIDNTGEYISITDVTKTYLEKISDYVDETNVIYLMPEWTPITVRLAYASNTGASGTAPKTLEVTVDSDVTLAKNTYTHATKSFMGWSMNSATTADSMYTGGVQATANMVFPEGYNVRSSKNSLQPYDLFSDPFSQYLDVKKWNNSFATSTYFNSSTGVLDLTSLTNQKIYAIWDDNTYTVKFDINNGDKAGASGKMEDQQIKVTADTALTKNGYEITGYTFIGWNDKPDGSGTIYLDGQTVTGLAKRNETITLYAQWKVTEVATVPFVVYQNWNDNNNQDGIRPENMTYLLTATAGGASLKPADIGLESFTFTTKSDESNVTIASVPQKYLSSTGVYEYITYKITATSVTGYTYETSVETGEKIVAKFNLNHTPVTTSYAVSIKLTDNNNQDGIRPTTVTVTLKGSDGSTQTANVTITGDTTTHTFANLPLNAKGKAITYTASLSNINGYTVTSSANAKATTFTGTHTPENISTTVTVKWNDNDNKANIRPTAVKVVIQLSTGKSVNGNISAVSNTTTITGIPKYSNGSATTGSLSVTPITGYLSEISGNLSQGFVVQMNITDIAKQTADAAAAKASDAAAKAASVGEDRTAVKKKTNTAKNNVNKELRTITLRTIWNDNNATFLRPLALKVSLVGSDGSSYDKTLVNASGYTAIFTDVPVNNEETGDVIEYKIRYAPIDGYTTHVYHNRKDQNEFIMEHFMPSEDNMTDTTALVNGNTLTNNALDELAKNNEVVVGGVVKEESDSLYADENGTPMIPSETLYTEPTEPTTSLLDHATLSKYVIPGAGILGLLAMLAAIIVLIRSRKQ